MKNCPKLSKNLVIQCTKSMFYQFITLFYYSRLHHSFTRIWSRNFETQKCCSGKSYMTMSVFVFVLFLFDSRASISTSSCLPALFFYRYFLMCWPKMWRLIGRLCSNLLGDSIDRQWRISSHLLKSNSTDFFLEAITKDN